MKFISIKLYFKAAGGPAFLDAITFPLDSTIETSQFILKSVDGLDPPDINVIVGDTIAQGGIYQGRRPQNREIVMRVGFQPNYAIGETSETLRNKLYPFLAPKVGLPITVGILGTGSVEIATATGHIKKMEANSWSKDPEVQITITCFDPYLFGVLTALSSPGTAPHNPTPITNDGTAPTGFYSFNVTLNSTASYFELFDSWSERLRFNYSFLSGDTVFIRTIIGQLSATTTRSGVTTNLLPYVLSTSKWLQLHPGLNNLYVNGPSAYTYGSILWYKQYWGV